MVQIYRGNYKKIDGKKDGEIEVDLVFKVGKKLEEKYYVKGNQKMSIHINAKKGEIAKIVLMPGDPYRARKIALKYLEDPLLVTDVRGMLRIYWNI